MAKTNLKEMPVEVRSSGKEPQNDFFAAFLEYVKQHADEAIAAVEAQKNAAKYFKDLKGSIIMEEKKKHIEIHIDIDKAADQLNVQIVAEKPTVSELFVCCLSIVSSAASTIADATNEDEQKVLRDIAGMVSAMADEPLEKEED